MGSCIKKNRQCRRERGQKLVTICQQMGVKTAEMVEKVHEKNNLKLLTSIMNDHLLQPHWLKYFGGLLLVSKIFPGFNSLREQNFLLYVKAFIQSSNSFFARAENPGNVLLTSGNCQKYL